MEGTRGNQNQQRDTQLQGNRLLRPDSAAAHLFAAGGGPVKSYAQNCLQAPAE